MRRNQVDFFEAIYKLDVPEKVLGELSEEGKNENHRPSDRGRSVGDLIRVGKTELKKLTRLLEIEPLKGVESF
jgi:hypothetical protein